MREFQGFKVIQLDKINEYKHSGVWAMFGIQKTEKHKGQYTCLNVGKSKCISDELKINFERLRHFDESRKKEYRNQFNEVMFTYEESASRQDWLYKEISEKYDEIIFILVTNQSENTYLIEKYFAYSFKSIYWVSNGRYAPNRIISASEIDRIRNSVDISQIDTTLINKICIFKVWYDSQ